MDNFRFQDLTSKPFLIGDLLRQEGLRLRDCRPLKDTPKQPSGSKSRLSEMSRTGEGPAHCIVRKWPADKTPVQWGMRNPFLLSDVVSPGIWEQLGGNYVAVKHDIAYSGLLDVRMNDNGNEEAYRLLIAKLLSRVTAAAFMFFLNAWSRHPTHQDFLPAIECLRRFDIKQETTSESSPIAIRGDVVSHIPRQLPLPKQNELEGASQTVALLFVNAKSTAHAEFHYQPIHLTNDFSSIRTVDQVMDFCLLESESRPQKLSVANLDSFLFENSIHVWPHIAAGHFSQVIFSYLIYDLCLSVYRWLTNHWSLLAPLVHFQRSGGSTGCVSWNMYQTGQIFSTYPTTWPPIHPTKAAQQLKDPI